MIIYFFEFDDYEMRYDTSNPDTPDVVEGTDDGGETGKAGSRAQSVSNLKPFPSRGLIRPLPENKPSPKNLF